MAIKDVLSKCRKRKHYSMMRTDRAVTRMSSEPVAIRPTVDRQTPVKTLPYLPLQSVTIKIQHL